MKSLFLIVLLTLTPFARSYAVDTEISERFFSVRLPGAWVTESGDRSSGLFAYRAKDLDAQLTVSVHLADPRPKASELAKLFESFVQIRREEEARLAPGIELFEVQRWRPGGDFTGLYQGRESNGRRTATFVIVNTAGIANFYLEAVGLSGEEFAEKIRFILRDVEFVE